MNAAPRQKLATHHSHATCVWCASMASARITRPGQTMQAGGVISDVGD